MANVTHRMIEWMMNCLIDEGWTSNDEVGNVWFHPKGTGRDYMMPADTPFTFEEAFKQMVEDFDG